MAIVWQYNALPISNTRTQSYLSIGMNKISTTISSTPIKLMITKSLSNTSTATAGILLAPALYGNATPILFGNLTEVSYA